MRQTDDLPARERGLAEPGSPNTAIDGEEMKPARNQENGSQQSVAPVTRSGPIGIPMFGRLDPAAIGHSPHVWTLVPPYSAGSASSPPDSLSRRQAAA